MRSRSSSLEDQPRAEAAQQRADARKRSAERSEPSGKAERRSRRREPPDDTGTVRRNRKTDKNGAGGSGSGSSSAGGAAKGGQKEKGRDLSRDDLVFLLSLLEGELQVIQTVEGGVGHGGSGGA